ncbi:LOW QUALITY PROTEIN: uncharacterized protein LOC116719367 [Xiphophorus hellerii]|uniref:LOW QUALITY PROTEIN: uncharacterized protein LOC116719367 n=1 Tax=Xiphophorus hellerii TaxID=8084 RepID=UPI0013B4336E|nr:LOW QUALITY PROTEIN: uncharacterized protein LOC116719367 [Xiphophorus hellerii]
MDFMHLRRDIRKYGVKRNAPECVKTYRRTNCKFETEINREIRFGGFASSSEGGYPSPHFGDQSCFEIITCFGARISKFSMFGWEKEVLIPPYEVFKVTDIQKRSGIQFVDNLPCKVVYKLKSTKNLRSGLNCALTKSGGRAIAEALEYLRKTMRPTTYELKTVLLHVYGPTVNDDVSFPEVSDSLVLAGAKRLHCLLPPYEVFRVTDIKERSKHNKLPCEVVYKLQSTNNPLSNLNCDLIEKKPPHGFN